jgi:hypothetical protein
MALLDADIQGHYLEVALLSAFSFSWQALHVSGITNFLGSQMQQ